MEDVTNFRKIIPSSAKAMADREKREEKTTETQKFEYLKNEKSFLDEIKSTLHNCLRIII